MDLNSSDVASLLQVNTDADKLGFDFQAGKTWVYPTNYPVREYQYEIIQSCLYQNTLVSLPTGLGKTFIAAVVMYNFYRWYPTGKIIFMAPTKPLVRQQIEACYNIMAIPPEATSEITGAKITASRLKIWNEKRVFFITPHILQNDLETIPDLGQKIRLVVIDEAHKALGKQANVEVIRKLRELNEDFRVVALSATPGSNFKNVTDIISNLLISHIECRTDESVDVVPYVFNRSLETVVVPLGGKLQQIKEQFIRVLDIYTRPLINYNVLNGNCSMMTKGKILLCMRDYKENCKNRNNYNQILCNLNICITLYHGYELLIRHGLRNFLSFFESCMDKPLIRTIKGIHDILNDLRNYLQPLPNIESLPDGTVPDIPKDTVFGHPKYYKLGEILSKHFKEIPEGETTKVMIFCEYRESVMEAYTLLLTHRPLIKPKIFIGKGAGITQAQQLLVIKMFREGKCNTLVATCIGEEGIDVGEVDLIVCFDISTKSPVRMVQRMGRTGRKRNGKVVMLVTEGKEQQTLQECLVQKTSMTNLLTSNHIKNHLYKHSRRMIPDGLQPTCSKLFITVPKKEEKKKDVKNSVKQKNTVKNMFETISQSKYSQDITENNYIPDFNNLPDCQEFWSKSKDEILETNKKSSIYNKRLEKQRTLKVTANFGHSSTTNAFVSLLKFADKKKYNLPTTHISLTQKNLTEPTLSQINNFRQIDIRNMFKPKPQIEEIIEIDEEEKTTSFSEIIDGICKYLKNDYKMDSCQICTNLFDCTLLMTQKEIQKQKIVSIPDFSIVDNINERNLDEYLNKFESKITLNESETFKHNMSEFIRELNAQNETIKPKNSCIHESLQFLKLTNIEDIFEMDPTSNCEVRTPKKCKKLVISSDVSPILASGRQKNIKTKLNTRYSQESSTPNINFEKKSKNITAKSFNFDAFESFAQNNSKMEQNKITDNSFKDILTDEKTIKNVNVNIILDNSNKIDKQNELIENNVDMNMDIDFYYNQQHLNENLSKSKSIFDESIEELKNVGNMFDIADESLFQSSGEINEQNLEQIVTITNVETKNLEIPTNNDIKSLFQSSSEINEQNLEQIVTKTNVETKNLENPTNNDIIKDHIIKTQNEIDKLCNIVDETLFESDNSKDSKINRPEQKANKIEYDTDATILISSDEEYFTEKPKIKSNKTLNLTINKTNTSLLSVTQLINFMDQKTLDNSLKENINPKNTPQNSSKPKNTNLILQNKMASNFEIINNITDIWDDDSDFEELKNFKTKTPVKSLLSKKTTTPNKKDNSNITKVSNFQDGAKTNKQTKMASQINTEPKIDLTLLESEIFTSNLSFSTQKDKSLRTNISNLENISRSACSSKTKENLIKLDETDSDNEESLLKFSLSQKRLSQNKNVSQDTPIRVKRNIKRPIELSDSDEDFQTKPFISQKNVGNTSNFELRRYNSENCIKKNKREPKLLIPQKNKKKFCAFIEEEAELSEDENYMSDSEHEDDIDAFESSFIHDTQISQHDNTDIQAKYLQSVKSPVINRRGFKIPKLPSRFTNVFSQAVDLNEENTYIQDSFCIDNEDSLRCTENISYLEQAEAELERQRREKKKTKFNKENKKRKRIIFHSDSD